MADDLREEYVELSKILARTALVTISILFVVVFAYTRASERVEQGGAHAFIRELQESVNTQHSLPELSYVFRWAIEPPVGQRVGQLFRMAPADPSPEIVAKAAAFEREAHDLFTIKPSLLGTEIDIDLRYWIAVLPLFLVGANLYLLILQSKRKAIRTIASARLETAESGEVSPLDALFFGGPATPYADHPGKLGAALYVAASLGLVAFFVVESRPLWTLWSYEALGSLVWLAALVGFWCFAFAYSIDRRLQQHAQAIAGVAPPVTLVTRCEALLRALPARCRAWFGRLPRVTAATGATLVLLSLTMPMAKSCTGDVLRGREVLFDDGFQWLIPHHELVTFGHLAAHPVYWVAVILAALTALAIVVSMVLRRTPRWFARWTTPLARMVAWFLFIDIAFAYPVSSMWPADDYFLAALFLIPLLLWIPLPGRREATARRRERIVALLLVLCAPGLVRAVIALVEVSVRGIPGVAVLLVGCVLLAFSLDAIRGYVSSPSSAGTSER
jgi:hypothetical protein